MQLSAVEARVVGSLLEKQLTTPQQYPLTITSLVAACNQTTNREPVVHYDESTVTSAIDALKQAKLVRSVLPSHGRSAVRYRHVLDETLALDPGQCALMAVLLLRGPQTIGELRTRTERMAEFTGLDEIEHELRFLSTRGEPLALQLERRPGQKEERWATPLVVSVPDQTGVERSVPVGFDADLSGPARIGLGDADQNPAESLNRVRTDLAALRAEVHELREELRALRASLGD
jgi:uncharacterized protein YceH (UPF0502 family)